GVLSGFFFFFQAEDGIRDATVTGVQTCALPISPAAGGRCRGAARRPRRATGGARSGAVLPGSRGCESSARPRGVHRGESPPRSVAGRLGPRAESVAPAGGASQGRGRTDCGAWTGRGEAEGVGTGPRRASGGPRGLRHACEPRVPQARGRDVRGRAAPSGTRDRGIEESLRAHGRPVQPDTPRDVRGGTRPW